MRKNLLIIFLLALVSCKKEDLAQSDSQSPIIMMTAPSNNQSFAAGQTITITAAISDNNRIKETHLEIINTTTGTFLLHEHHSPDGTNFQINKAFTAQAASAYRIKIEAEDLAGNKAKSEVNIFSN